MSDLPKNEPWKLNPYAEAAKESPNLLGLTGLAALSLATLNPVPMLIGVVAETAYLITVPDMPWYRRRVTQREQQLYREEVVRRREALKQEILPLLPVTLVERYEGLEQQHAQVSAGAPDQGAVYGEIIRKLDHLLERFLLFAQKDVQFRTYLQGLYREGQGAALPPGVAVLKDRKKPVSLRPGPPEPGPGTGPDAMGRTRVASAAYSPGWVEQVVEGISKRYRSEQAEMDAQRANAPDDNTAQIIEKRKEVLERRFEYVQKIGKLLVSLDHQMHLLEDTFGLMNDEVRARPTKEVLNDVDEVVVQANLTSEMLDQFQEVVA